jgi:hypothetical protein
MNSVIYYQFRKLDDADKCKKLSKKYQEEYKDKFDSDKWNSYYKDEILKKGLVFKYDQNRDLI